MAAFNSLNQADKETILEIVAKFHYRDGTRHSDGSMGTISITPQQMNDVLASVFNDMSREECEVLIDYHNRKMCINDAAGDDVLKMYHMIRLNILRQRLDHM